MDLSWVDRMPLEGVRTLERLLKTHNLGYGERRVKEALEARMARDCIPAATAPTLRAGRLQEKRRK